MRTDVRSAGGGRRYERLGYNSAEDFDWGLVDSGFYQTTAIRGREDLACQNAWLTRRHVPANARSGIEGDDPCGE